MAKKVKKTAANKKSTSGKKKAASSRSSAAGKTGKTTPKAAKKTKTAPPSDEKSSKKTRSKVKSPLSPKELRYFRGLLLEKLKEILGDVDWIESEALKNSRMNGSGDLSTMPIHMADLGTDNYEQEFSLGLMDSERKIVQEIMEALKRIENGTYGLCEGTGNPIPKARLEANPWARYCVEYATLVEQGKAVEKWNRIEHHARVEVQDDFEDEEDEEELGEGEMDDYFSQADGETDEEDEDEGEEVSFGADQEDEEEQGDEDLF